MRIDKFLTGCGKCSRTEAAKAAKSGQITVNGRIVRDASIHIDPEKDSVVFMGEPLTYSEYTYIMLNKPEGFVCATEDSGPTVIDLLSPELKRLGLFPCGRLDKNTHGFVLLTNNGPLAHRLISPKHHRVKEYYFTLLSPLSENDRLSMERGVVIPTEKGSYTTKPCTVTMSDEKNGIIALTEGKYHQIKLMAKAVGNMIVYLKRISFAGIALDPLLSEGEWRFLTDEEISAIISD